ncbi:hypothetical protein GCM10023342_15660 [Modicisalibacter zincidurans]|uniref:Uncharacterized protein n=1 Tax=Modicisalibacter zincidurans TaxID=1178777 RepID=A0ABP9RC11_9GAMM
MDSGVTADSHRSLGLAILINIGCLHWGQTLTRRVPTLWHKDFVKQLTAGLQRHNGQKGHGRLSCLDSAQDDVPILVVEDEHQTADYLYKTIYTRLSVHVLGESEYRIKVARDGCDAQHLITMAAYRLRLWLVLLGGTLLDLPAYWSGASDS